MAVYNSSFTGSEIDARLTAVGTEFVASNAYPVGSLTLKNGVLYQKTSGNTTESWNASHWTQVSLSDVGGVDKTLAVSNKAADAKAAGDKIGELKSAITPLQDAEQNDFSQIDEEEYFGSYAISEDESHKITKISDSNWKSIVYGISGYNVMCVTTAIYGSTYYGVLFADNDDNVISKELYKGNNEAELVKDVFLTVPANATKVYVNARSNVSYKAKVKVYKTPVYQEDLASYATKEEVFTKTLLPVTQYIGSKVVSGNVGSVVSLSNSADWRSAVYDISGYDTIFVSTIIYGTTHYGAIFTNSSDVIISKELYKGSSGGQTVTDYELSVPENATKVYINKRSATSGDKGTVSVYEKPVDATSFVDTAELKLFAVNCGSFQYDDYSLTDEEYKANWRKMINESDADLFALSDYDSTFGSLEDTSDIVLFGNTVKKFIGSGNGLRLATRINAEFIESIDVGGESAWRKIVYKYKVKFATKEIIVYVGQYQPGEEMASVRATQYANTIADAQTNQYQYVIFCGDFNAWAVEEYAPFVTAGYSLCNGGYTGTHNTLREICADNIIYSGNLMETGFDVLAGKQLNTDHTPIIAKIKIR